MWHCTICGYSLTHELNLRHTLGEITLVIYITAAAILFRIKQKTQLKV
jgi:hypothetical protein